MLIQEKPNNHILQTLIILGLIGYVMYKVKGGVL